MTGIWDFQIRLAGPESIVGRSIVIHSAADGGRWVCADIVAKGGAAAPAPVGEPYALAEAVFDMKGVTGSITFSQRHSGGDTVLTLALEGLKEMAKDYHVHTKPLDQTAASLCSADSVGGHFNPFNVDYAQTQCNPSRLATCEVGDLSGKHGTLSDLYRVPSTVILDPQIRLSGRTSIVGRSIVIHSAADGGRWVCADIVAKGGAAAAAAPVIGGVFTAEMPTAVPVLTSLKAMTQVPVASACPALAKHSLSLVAWFAMIAIHLAAGLCDGHKQAKLARTHAALIENS